jgi:hypothetical protein
MIKSGVHGVYCFFRGEERGGIGSSYAASALESSLKMGGNHPLQYVLAMVSFDRRGTTDVITHQCGGRTCSDEFGATLAYQLNAACSANKYSTSNAGVYTDSSEFSDIIPECTNVAVGYNLEHTKNEYQDVKHLMDNLVTAVVCIEASTLPIIRRCDEDEHMGVTLEDAFMSTPPATIIAYLEVMGITGDDIESYKDMVYY